MTSRDILQKFHFGIPTQPHNVIDITDPEKDLDDEQKFLLMTSLAEAGIINIKAVVANLEPPVQRALLAKGTFNSLGHNEIPVGIGTDCFKGGQNPKHETEVSYLAETSEVIDGYQLLVSTLETAEDNSIILMLNSGLTDAAQLLRLHTNLFVQKIANVTIMGGFKAATPTTPLLQDGLLIPDDAANNSFDPEAADYLYKNLQRLSVPMTVIMRSACYAAQFDIHLYDKFAATNHNVGRALKKRQKDSLQQLWQAALSPEGSPVRGKLPMSRDRKWFTDVFCDKQDPGIGLEDEIWPFVGKYNQYDPMAVIAALPELREHFFESIKVVVGDAIHLVIGLSPQTTGIKNKESLVSFMTQMELAVLQATH
ncbi:MAG TPA: nucleoside hydrolase [Candidatus Magasanikbacteria bacterium]|nr:nucleoside hydrolase [Candidatus Magasanikbacteria bacterium]